MSISSKELNYLIWRYLQEAGFELSAYALQKESKAQKMQEVMDDYVGRGSLVDIVQRGIQYFELEAKTKQQIRHISTDLKPYSLLKALTIEEDISKNEALPSSNGHAAAADIKSLQLAYRGPFEQVTEWNPNNSAVVAVGNTDSCEIWDFSDDKSSPKLTSLIHSDSAERDKNTTFLKWNHAGSVLAQGSFEGKIRIWTADCKLRYVHAWHRAPVVALAWNSTDTLLLSLDVNNNATVWDAFSGDIRQSVACVTVSTAAGNGPTSQISSATVGNDAAWIDSSTFAVTGESAMINVYKVGGSGEPVIRFRGHAQGVNSLEFDESTQLLCSASDDHTVRIWHGKSALPLVLIGHSAPVLIAKWIAKPLDLNNLLRLKHILSGSLVISASMDGTIRLWDPVGGQSLLTIDIYQSAPVFCLEVSPSGRFIASGGVDGTVYLWNVESLYGAESMEDALNNFSKPSRKYQLDSETASDTDLPTDRAISALSWNANSSEVIVTYPTKSVVLEV